ncbi:hypothetical protein NQ314_019341 [Rhamnusium bicolor]|uniref:Uncharacterized protein n=1 Tax=Rhamnusium bicolor TaxID=1586634 RepID=A0AAV8WPS4_9CUCU|nr:hypothetical protein NQ314_019341 [Rhamnusium bicolor]
MVDIKNSDFEMKNKDEEDLVDIGDIKFQVEVNISDFEVDIGTETMPEQKSEKIVHLNCHDHKNSLPQIDETEMSPVSHFSENSSGNFSEHQQEFNDNIVIRDNKLARIECNNKLYNQINISSSEGFVSDSSEIRSPLKKCKNGMNRRSIREKEIETNHCDNYNSVSSNKQSIDEDDFDIIEYENTSQISEDLGKIVAINKEVGYDLPEYTDDETSNDNLDISHETKKSNNAEIALKKSGYDLPEYTDDETSDDNLDISHETKKSNNAEIALKKSGVKDIIPNIRRQKTAKSVFAESFEKSDLIKKEPSTETSDILEISDMVQEEVNNDDIETVQRMSIVLPFPVPPLHSILTRTTTPSKEQLGEIKRQNLEVKTGPFSKEEDRMIIDNWKRFYKEHDLTVNPSLFIKFPRRMKLREKTDFLRYLAHGLDNRLLHRVHARFKHLVKMPHLKSGRFSPEEDEKLLNFINEAKLSNPFATLWTLPMVDRLVVNMKNVTKCDKVKHLKHKKLTEREWKKLSKKMDNIPVRKLQRAWNVTIYPRLFAKSVNLKTMKEDIIHILYKRNETDWKTVNWKEIAENYKGFTPQKIYMMFKTLVNFHVPDTKRKNLAECLEYLEHILLKQSKISTPHRFKKFKCEQGHIVYKNESE